MEEGFVGFLEFLDNFGALLSQLFSVCAADAW